MASFDGLDRMNALLAALGNPEADFRVIHIAGTNGKGSTAVMIASILEEAGYSVGLFMSPHLESECERVQIWDGTHRMIDQEKLDSLKEKVKETANNIDVKQALHMQDDVKNTLHKYGNTENIDIKNTLHTEAEHVTENVKRTLHQVYGNPTVFEVYTAAAYLSFAEEKPDYVVLETGLGGRLDSTNTIEKPLVSVITRVGLDHTKELGNTIYKIAHEKAGIIKEGVPVVSQTAELAVKNILRRTAEEKGAPFTDVSARMAEYELPALAMRGEHQKKNAACAVEAIRAAGIEVPDEAVSNGLTAAFLAGRFEILGEDPYFIIDGAHNPDAIEALIDTYSVFARTKRLKRTMVIFGCMQDKDSSRMIQLLTKGLRGCTYVSTAVSYSRAEDPERIAELIAASGRGCTICETADEAYELARGSGYECILVTGSIYLAGEMRSLYMQDKRTIE